MSERGASRTTSPAADQALRRYLGKVLIRWSPLLVCTTVLALVVALSSPTPTSSQSMSGRSGGVGSNGATGPQEQTALGSSSTRSDLAAGSATSTSPGAGSGFGPTGTATGGTSSAGGGSAAGVGAAATSATPGSASTGLTVSGTHCAPGIPQVAWTQYSPPCRAVFHGDNGGATSHGVTASTITLSYAEPNSSQQQALAAVSGAAAPNPAAYVADLKTYIAYFDREFELYGRKVVLKPFQAQGDYLEEDQGQDLGGAQADAQTASDEGAFGDVTFPGFSSQYYWQDLALDHVIGFGGTYYPQSWFDQYAPYEYSVFTPSGTTAANEAVDTVCRRMAHLPAIFAGSSSGYRSTIRRFGLITPVNPIYVDNGDAIQNGLASCGAKPVVYETYALDITTAETQATSIIAKLKADGVTTVVCGCDPISLIFYTEAADQQSYYPEWLSLYWGDPYAQDYPAEQWKHAIVAGGVQFPPLAQTQAYKVFLQASGGSPPAEQYFYVAYYELLPLFGALQEAGPDLTPQTFEQGWFSLPSVSPGSRTLGVGWTFGPGSFDPVSSFHIAWFDPNATSNADGKAGAYQYCNGGQEYAADDPSSLGGPNQQLACG